MFLHFYQEQFVISKQMSRGAIILCVTLVAILLLHLSVSTSDIDDAPAHIIKPTSSRTENQQHQQPQELLRDERRHHHHHHAPKPNIDEIYKTGISRVRPPPPPPSSTSQNIEEPETHATDVSTETTTPTPHLPTPTPFVLPQGEIEINVAAESTRFPDELNFTHTLKTIFLPPKNVETSPPEPMEIDIMRRAFNAYTTNRADPTFIPVYTTACIGASDCSYVVEQMRSLDTGVGHIIVLQNGPADDTTTKFLRYANTFPGRFSFYLRPDKLGCAESWNTMLRLGFSIRPVPEFVLVMNGDLWAMPGYLAKFAEYCRSNAHMAVNRFFHFSAYAMMKVGWERLGGFDENVFPAYAEDVEYHIRVVSAGMDIGNYPASFDPNQRTHQHIGHRSYGDNTFLQRIARWDRRDYLIRKWGVDHNAHSDFKFCKPWATPWNITGLSHRESWFVDPVHRECVVTGNGPKHFNEQSSPLADMNRCSYNAAVVVKAVRAKGFPDSAFPDAIRKFG